MRHTLYILIWCSVTTIMLSACGGGSDSGGSSGIPSGPVNPTPTSTKVTGVSINKSTLSLVEGKAKRYRQLFPLPMPLTKMCLGALTRQV